MKVYNEESIHDFKFWDEAADHAEMLTESELDQFEDYVELAYPDGIESTMLNDWMWFDFESVCAVIGVIFDAENNRVIR